MNANKYGLDSNEQNADYEQKHSAKINGWCAYLSLLFEIELSKFVRMNVPVRHYYIRRIPLWYHIINNFCCTFVIPPIWMILSTRYSISLPYIDNRNRWQNASIKIDLYKTTNGIHITHMCTNNMYVEQILS